jgi:hypothetical protein
MMTKKVERKTSKAKAKPGEAKPIVRSPAAESMAYTLSIIKRVSKALDRAGS